MDIQTEEIEYCKLKFNYTADPNKVEEKRQDAIAELRKLSIPGFRPGKAPDYAIKARCKKQINDWVARELASQAFDDIIFETKLKPIGSPKLETVQLKDNQFSCSMVVTKKPDFNLEKYQGFEIPRPHINRDVDGQVQKTLQDLRMRFGDILPYKENDFVEIGDQITMDVIISADQKVLETFEGHLYSIGENRWPGFDDNLQGMAPGEEREFDLKLAEDDVATHFKVLVHMGTKRVPCPMDDVLAQKVGLASYDEVRQKIETLVTHKMKQAETQMIRNQAANHLVAGHDFKVPDWLVNLEAQHLAAQNELQWTQLSDEEKEIFIKKATDNVKLSLILDSIRDKEPESVLSDSETQSALKQQLLLQGVDPEKFLVESQKNGRLIGMLAAMRDEFTLQWVADKSILIDA